MSNRNLLHEPLVTHPCGVLNAVADDAEFFAEMRHKAEEVFRSGRDASQGAVSRHAFHFPA
jgi:hypothetical protein